MARRRAPRGTGGTGYDRHRGSWYARIYTRDANGKRVAHRVWARTSVAAEDALVGLRARYGIDSEADEPQATLETYLRQWLSSHERAVRPSTALSYRSHIERHIIPLLGGIPVHRLRARDVDRLVADRLAAGLSPATVVRIVMTLRVALNRAVRRHLIPNSPARYADLPRVEPRVVEPMTEAMAQRIVEATTGTWVGPLVVLLLGSGLRIGEAVGLDWGDVHEEAGFVLVRTSKTRARAVPISDDAAAMLADLRRAAVRVGPHEPVFRMQRVPRLGDDRMRPQSVTHALPRILEAAGLPPVSPHALRHGVATIMVARGAHMRVIADQLGHRDPALTARIYAHVIPQLQRDAVKLLNRRKDA